MWFASIVSQLESNPTMITGSGFIPEIGITSVLVFLLLTVLSLGYTYWRSSRSHFLELAKGIPGPKGYPIIGNALEYFGSSSEIFTTLRKYLERDETIVKTWIGPRLLVFLLDPRDAEIILNSHVHLDKSTEYRVFEPWFGKAGLLISTGTTWKSHRKLIAPAFHLNVLKGFIDIFNINSRNTVEKLRKEVGRSFDCHDYLSEAMVEILLETVMGVTRELQGQSGYDYAMAVMKMCDILHFRHLKLWLMSDFLFNLTNFSKTQKNLLGIIQGLTKKVVKTKVEAFNLGIRGSMADVPIEFRTTSEDDTRLNRSGEGLSFEQSYGLKDDLDVEDNDIGEKKRLAFLDVLIEASQNSVVITNEEIQQQVDTIMFEGHDTTAAASSFFLSLLGCHQKVQDRAIQEIDGIFGNSDRPATFADTLKMKYLERCLLETLRLYPPVPIIARGIKEDIKMASGEYTLPAGCTAIIGIYKIHRRSDIYPNPNRFDPDNFLPERTASRHYYSFIPFSAGPRSCVGRKYAMLKLKILLSTIMRKFRVISDVSECDFKLQGDIILKRAEGFKIRLEPRKCTADSD